MNSPLKKLTQAQQQAILCPADKHAVVVAVAGAGKTTVLEQRIKYLLKQNKAGQLVITFTKRAAANIVDRLGTVPSSVFVGTFHAFCHKTLKEFAPNTIGRKFITDADEFKLYIYAEQTITATNNRVTAKDAIVSIELLFRRGLRPSEWASADKNRALNLVAKGIYDKARADGFMFFSELLLDTKELLEKRPDIAEELSSRYPIIMVDEFQDTDDTQVGILKALTDKGSALFVVGDSSQAIYTWRGCNPKIISGFSRIFGESDRIVLDTNFRSTDNILATANHVLADLQAETRMVGVKGVHANEVLIVKDASPVAEARNIAERIAAEGRHESTAVLYRSNSQSGALESELAKKKIPYMVSGNAKSFFAFPEIQPFICYLRLLTCPSDVDSLRYVWNRPNRFLKNDWLTNAAAKHTSIKVLDILREAGARNLNVNQRSSIQSLTDFVTNFYHTDIAPQRIIKGIIKSFNYESYVKSLAEKSLTREEGDIKRAIAQLIEIASEFTSITGFLNHVSFIESTQKQNQALKDGVLLSTIHSAKGLEFTDVYVIGVEEGILPHENSTDMDEEHRLLYVAVTRAEQYLRLSYYDKPSRFIKDRLDVKEQTSV